MWDKKGKEAVVLILVGMILIGITLLVEKKVTGYYPWEYPRTLVTEGDEGV